MTEEDKPGLRANWQPDSDVLLVAFGGIRSQERPRHAYELTRVTARFAVNRIYLMDDHGLWYHHGIEGHTGNIDETADYLRRAIEARGFRRIVFLGVSGGGYAALLLGRILEVDEVHAIAPRTFLDMDNRLEHADYRLIDNAMSLYESDRAQPQYFDLRSVFDGPPKSETQFHVYYAERARIDRAHANHLAGVENVALHGYQLGSHRLGKWLRDQGHLDEILEAALLADDAA